MKLNQSTWTDDDKCGLNQSRIEPNLYTHPTARILVACFADNNLGAYKKEHEALYLQIKHVYNKYIKVDYVGLHPISQFLGVQMIRDRVLKLMTIKQTGYINRVSSARAGKFEKHSTPVGNSKTDRDAFTKLRDPNTTDEKCDRSEFLCVLGELGWVVGMTRGDLYAYFVVLAGCMQAPSATALKFLYRVYKTLVLMRVFLSSSTNNDPGTAMTINLGFLAEVILAIRATGSKHVPCSIGWRGCPFATVTRVRGL